MEDQIQHGGCKASISTDLFSVSGVERDVCEDIAARQQAGIEKYGATVASNPAELREWLQHAYEESLDKAIYLKRAMREVGKVQQELETLRHLCRKLLKHRSHLAADVVLDRIAEVLPENESVETREPKAARRENGKDENHE